MKPIGNISDEDDEEFADSISEMKESASRSRMNQSIKQKTGPVLSAMLQNQFGRKSFDSSLCMESTVVRQKKMYNLIKKYF